MADGFTVVVSSGTLATDTPTTFVWPDGRTHVDSPFTGLHMTHLALGGCVLNDTLREAGKLSVSIDGVRVSVRGDFALEEAVFGAVEYVLEIDSPAPEADVVALVDHVEALAEIPRALAASVKVTRVEA
jgi:hypothetical protein